MKRDERTKTLLVCPCLFRIYSCLFQAPDLPPVAYGKEAARRVFAAWIDAFDDFSGEIEEYIDIDDRHVACLVHYRGEQRDSGLVIAFTAVDMWEFRGSKLIRGTLGYRDRESALSRNELSGPR